MRSISLQILISLFCLSLWSTAQVVAQTSLQPNVQTTGDSKVPAWQRFLNMEDSQNIFIDDVKIVRDDINQLGEDLGFGSLADNFLRDFLSVRTEEVFYSRKSGFSLPGAFVGETILGFVIVDRELMLEQLDVDGDIEEGEFFRFYDTEYLPIQTELIVGHEQQTYGIISGNQLFVCEDDQKESVKAALESERVDEDFFDDKMKEILDLSGISVAGTLEFADEFIDDFTEITQPEGLDLTESELEWLRSFGDVAKHAQASVLGFKYQESKDLQFRARVKTPDEHSFEKIVNLENRRDWNPDLGFEKEGLIFSGSIQMDAFHSAAPIRAIPRLLLYEFGNQRNFKFLQGNMLRLLSELMGDSWNDLTAARVAVYQNLEADKHLAGEIAIMGVLDAKSSANVLKELEALAAVTSPMMAAERSQQKQDEIAELIEQLASSTDSEAVRAETRLRLAGPSAIESLDAAFQRSTAGPFRNRVERILTFLRTREKEIAETTAVADPYFWTRLNPGLALQLNEGEVDGYQRHIIEISPDPSKTDQQVADATAIMVGLLGPDWNQLQIVQVKDHFVFMLGSNQDLLKKFVANTNLGTGKISKSFEGVGQCDWQSPLQFSVDAAGLSKLLGYRNWLRQKTKPADQPVWLGVNMSEHAIGIDILIPVQQIIPFFFNW